MRKLNTKALVPLIGTSPFHGNYHITRCMSGPDCGPLKPSDKYLHSVYMYKCVSLTLSITEEQSPLVIVHNI